MNRKDQFRLRLNGKTCVMIDWANVYGWKGKLKSEVDEEKLLKYLKRYKEIGEIRFYFGDDKTSKKSGIFLKKISKIGYKLISKEVKFIKIYDESGKKFILKRKCDFDLEIGLDCFELMDRYNSFIFFSGDGDYKTLYERLVKKRKQVIVVYAHGALGREIWEMSKGLFKIAVDRLDDNIFKKNAPPVLKPRGVISSIIAGNKKK